jgi:hypothetical protein
MTGDGGVEGYVGVRENMFDFNFLYSFLRGPRVALTRTSLTPQSSSESICVDRQNTNIK